MTSPAATPNPAARPGLPELDLGEAFGRLLRRPAEGWLTLVAAVAMVVTLGASFVNAGWTLPEAGDTGFLLYIGSVGLAFGFVGAKLGWGRWRTHVIGALFAGLLLPLIAGGLLLEARGTPVGWDPFGLWMRMDTAAHVARNVWTDLVVLRQPYTAQSAHYHMVFGGLIWGAGQLAGFTIFGHRRPLDAVVVVGLVLLANMAMTSIGQELFLVAFSASALVLLIRTHIFEEEVTWARRKIGDPAAVGRLYLNGGAAFVIATVLGSTLLMYTASSAPLQGLWKDLPQHLQGFSQLIQAIAPPGGEPIQGITSFGSSSTASGIWRPAGGVAFRAQLPPGEDAQFKWRAGTYAEFKTFGWAWAAGDPPATTNTEAAAGDPLLTGLADAPSLDGRRAIQIGVSPDAFLDRAILAPNTIQSVDVPTVARTIGTQGWFAAVQSRADLAPYTVTAWVRDGLTEAQLRVAGKNYPSEVRTLYLQYPSGSVGPQALALLDEIRASARAQELDPTNPYDLARTMERYLADDRNFDYATNIKTIRDNTCGNASMAECFAIIRTGYCEYYATTMAVLLRYSDVPARIAYGFLPGERDDNNVETVSGSQAHWWVEVYFPGVGWVDFDPTGGSIGQQVALPSGSIGPQTPRPTLDIPIRSAGPSFNPGAGPTGGNGGTGSGIGPFIAIALILVIGVGALMFAAYRRAPSKPMDPDHAWGSLSRLAARFGLGPRPSQTVYEYAGALGDQVPGARVELTTIARAKVEVAYGRKALEGDALKRIALAYQRLRLAILGVVLRRGLRRGRR